MTILCYNESMDICEIDGCVKVQHARFMCSTHYRRRQRHGTLLGTKTKPACIPIEERFWSKVARADQDSCWEWAYSKRDWGYGQFSIKLNGRWGGVPAHRVAWELTYGDIPSGLFVLHRCDNPPCCNPNHLFLGTPLDNVEDCRDKGRSRWACGEAAGSAKLTALNVVEIRSRYAAGGNTQQALANEYGVSPSTISGVVLLKYWQHV